MELLSVIIPTYRRVSSVTRLVQLLDQQTEADLEILVIDQNGNDELARLCSARFPLRRLQLDSPNASAARNVGFLASRGNLLLFLDDDIRPEPEFCSKGVRRFHRLPAGSFLWPCVYDQAGKDRRLCELGRIQRRRSDRGELREVVWAESSAIFTDRETFRRSGGFDERLFQYTRGGTEDTEFGIRAGKRGLRTWIDTSLEVFHDSAQTGGCELRVDSYWESRQRLMKGWAYRYRVQGTRGGTLGPKDLWHLSRSAFLNTSLIRRSPWSSWRECLTLSRAIRDSRRYLRSFGAEILSPEKVDFLTPRLRLGDDF